RLFSRAQDGGVPQDPGRHCRPLSAIHVHERPGGAMFRSSQFLVVLLALSLAATASAQGERGVIGGTVADAQGGVLPGVTVTARNINTGVTQSVVTEADGRYRFGALPLGTYEVKAELVGFSTATITNLTITINREL